MCYTGICKQQQAACKCPSFLSSFSNNERQLVHGHSNWDYGITVFINYDDGEDVFHLQPKYKIYQFYANPTTQDLTLHTLPLVGLSSAVMMRKVVVLPAPLGPSRPNTCPFFTSIDKLFSATNSCFSSFLHEFFSDPFLYALPRFWNDSQSVSQ